MILFAHGLEGSPEGKKVQAIRAAGHLVEAPDFRGMCLQERVDLLEVHSRKAPRVWVGSSYGGLAMAVLAAQFPTRCAGLLLLAPALLREEAPVPSGGLVPPPGLPCVILHGRGDTLCPIDASRSYAALAPGRVRLREVEDEHRLIASFDAMLEELEGLLVAGSSASGSSASGSAGP